MQTSASSTELITIIAQVAGPISPNMSTPLIDIANNNVELILPASAILVRLTIARPDAQPVGENVGLSLGYAGNIGALLNNEVTTTQLNNSEIIVKNFTGVQFGLQSDKQVFLHVDGPIETGIIQFELTYQAAKTKLIGFEDRVANQVVFSNTKFVKQVILKREHKTALEAIQKPIADANNNLKKK